MRPAGLVNTQHKTEPVVAYDWSSFSTGVNVDCDTVEVDGTGGKDEGEATAVETH